MPNAEVSATTLLLFSTIALISSTAQGDTFQWTRSEALVEKDHTVTITLARDHAKITAVRTIHNGGERPDQALFHIYPGEDRVAVGLRTRAMVEGVPVWFEGDLLEAEEAARRYQELTGIGGYYPKDPALLSWRDQGHLALQVFPCMPGEDKQVAYTLLAPMHYEAGRYVLEIPAMGTEDHPAVATLRGEASEILVDGVKPSAAITLDHAIRVEQAATFGGVVAGGLGSTTFDKGRVLANLHLELPPKLSRVPGRARVVLVVDGSRSQADETRAAQLAAGAAYLGHFQGPDVKAAVLRFDRRVDNLTQGFVSVDGARAALSAMPHRGKNGSELGLALEAAHTLLAAADPGAEKRIVVLTDLRTRESLSPTSLGAIRASGAIVHIGVIDVGETAIVRDDDDAWASIPRSTGGLLFRGSTSAGPDEEAKRKSVFEEWARPKRLERLRLSAPGFLEGDEALLDGATLEEGQGFEQHVLAKRYVPFATLTAELWSRPITKTWAPDAEYGKRQAALIFGSDLLGELTEPEMMTLARYGGAVSPVTSYLAIEPGVRPSTEGLSEGEGIGSGQGFGMGHGRLGGVRYGRVMHTEDLEKLLRETIELAVRSCVADEGATSVEVESTLNEMVRVDARVVGDDAGKKKARCVVEGVFGVFLPSAFKGIDHRTTSVVL